MRGKKKCLFHIGNNARELGAKGGRRRAIYNPENLEPFTAPQTAEDVVRLLSHTLVETRAGKIDPRVASTIAQLSNTFMQAFELSTLEERLRLLEEKQDKPTIN